MRQPLKPQLQLAPSVDKALGDSLLFLRAPHQQNRPRGHDATSPSSDTACLPSPSPSPPPPPCRRSSPGHCVFPQRPPSSSPPSPSSPLSSWPASSIRRTSVGHVAPPSCSPSPERWSTHPGLRGRATLSLSTTKREKSAPTRHLRRRANRCRSRRSRCCHCHSRHLPTHAATSGVVAVTTAHGERAAQRWLAPDACSRRKEVAPSGNASTAAAHLDDYRRLLPLLPSSLSSPSP